MVEADLINSNRDDDVSKDEYNLALDDDIEDESLLESPAARKFVINSYGADYTVDSLVKRMRSKSFIVPEFQRKFVWTLRHSSEFIESLLMGLPVPGIFLYKEAETNTHLVIDGQQRLRTLHAFYDGLFGGREFRLVGVQSPWEGKTYSELDTSDVFKLDDSVVHATIFQQDSPKDVMDSIYYVFKRINSGGIRLSPQEIRNCVNLGPFINLARELNENKSWRNIFGKKNTRAKDEELIVRFLALYENGATYSRPMNKFLDNFAEKMNKADESVLKNLGLVFLATIDIVEKALGVRAFRLIRALNAAVFDAVMVGLANRIFLGEPLDVTLVTSAYYGLLENQSFVAACERATADEENVQTRRRLATEAFARV